MTPSRRAPRLKLCQSLVIVCTQARSRRAPGQWDVGNSYKMEGKAGANWGGISSSLRSCHAAHSSKFLSPLLLFSTHPLSFPSSETQGQIVGTRKILNGREKWREEGSPRMFLFSPAMQAITRRYYTSVRP